MDKALQTQIANLQSRSGKSLEELFAFLRASGHQKHGQLRDYLKTELGMGGGDANIVVHLLLNPDVPKPKGTDETTAALAAIYAGPKAGLRPLHDAVMTRIGTFGTFEVALPSPSLAGSLTWACRSVCNSAPHRDRSRDCFR